jgi:cell wall-associated NlpC family hydrolase
VKTRRTAPLVIAAVLLVGAAGLTGCTPGNQAVDAARSQIGNKYVYGSASPSTGFDCSGLTSWAWGQAGVSLPRSSAAQWDWVDKISKADLRAGDLVFYSAGGPQGRVSHVALYTGQGTIVHARNSSLPVMEEDLDRYWVSNLVGYGRVPASAMR